MNYFFFDSYGIEGMKHFIISDDKIIVRKILKEIETIDQKDKKLALCKLKFSMSAYERLKEKRNQKNFRKCSKPFSFNT